ncbi:MAG: ATP-binding protein [Propionibacteriaceae bacterium]|jgi:AAA+ ATPase superfamily predicted ATPase|nr:ATP-binding protein [Propionibacteriaceae bacterium]
MDIIGRKEEQRLLKRYWLSDKPEFIAVYGRRRVGKTYLVREFFGDFAFRMTGAANVSTRNQLADFDAAIRQHAENPYPRAQNWREAFEILRDLLEAKLADPRRPSGKLVVFLDELPWLDRKKSGFVSALEHFWNDWAASRPEILLIVCGSSTSWIVKKLFKNRGGLHNRLTGRIGLAPFSLAECEEYLAAQSVVLNRYQVLQAYMICGGIPYYLSLFDKHFGLTQNIDHLFFTKNAPLRDEFEELFASLFANPGRHTTVVRALARNRTGISRDEVIQATKIADGGSLTQTLAELEQAGFTAKSVDFTKAKKGALYRLVDPFVLFYLRFVERNRSGDEYFWTNYTADAGYRAWTGLAFEEACLLHLRQLRAALGIAGVSSEAVSWRSDPSITPGAQIDLLIDRRDQIINLCEMKYTAQPFTIDKSTAEALQRRRQVFVAETGTRKAIHLTMITPYGLADTGYRGDIQSEVTMEDLFQGSL